MRSALSRSGFSQVSTASSGPAEFRSGASASRKMWPGLSSCTASIQRTPCAAWWSCSMAARTRAGCARRCDRNRGTAAARRFTIHVKALSDSLLRLNPLKLVQ